jgi:cytochrome P450
MLSVLVNKPEGDGGLTADELDNIVISFFGAGFETTAHLIGNGVFTLDQHPEQRALLLARPELAAGAVEEVLRHSSSLNAIYRVAFEDVEIEGQHIRKGIACSSYCRPRTATRHTFPTRRGSTSNARATSF